MLVWAVVLESSQHNRIFCVKGENDAVAFANSYAELQVELNREKSKESLTDYRPSLWTSKDFDHPAFPIFTRGATPFLIIGNSFEDQIKGTTK